MAKNNDSKNVIPTQQDASLPIAQNADTSSEKKQVCELSPDDIAARLRALRAFHHYSQQDIADALGVQKQTVSGWETCKSLPSPRYVARLRDVYHISAEQLLDLSIPVEELFLSSASKNKADSAQKEQESEKQQEKELLNKWFVLFFYVLLVAVMLLATTYPPVGLIICIGYFFSKKRLGIQNRIFDVIVILCILFNCLEIYWILDDLFFHFGYGKTIPIESLLNLTEVYHASL